MKEIYGQKLGMTRVFTDAGDSVGVTVIRIDPATVIRVKTKESDGYDALVVGFGQIRSTLVSKPIKGQFDKAGVEYKRYLREIKFDGTEKPEVGATFTAEIFKAGQKVHVSGVSRGLGFQGAVKRHGFAGGPKTHGQSDRLRAPGSIGQSSYPSRVFKGMKMSGRMGKDKVTVKNLKIVAVEPEQSLVLVSGVVPGHKNSLILVRKAR
ncbi:MAG: 50S ribosomal protein L3 [candidate division Zixibacteria bacterium]